MLKLIPWKYINSSLKTLPVCGGAVNSLSWYRGAEASCCSVVIVSSETYYCFQFHFSTQKQTLDKSNSIWEYKVGFYHSKFGSWKTHFLLLSVFSNNKVSPTWNEKLVFYYFLSYNPFMLYWNYYFFTFTQSITIINIIYQIILYQIFWYSSIVLQCMISSQ